MALAQVGNALYDALAALGDGARTLKYGPDYAEKRDHERATRELDLTTRRQTVESNRLTLADKLSNLIGMQMEGFGDEAETAQRAAGQMTVGDEEGGAGGFAMNLPAEGAVPPDFSATAKGFDTGLDPAVVAEIARGKVGQGKRAMAELRGAQRLGELDARTASAQQRDADRFSNQRERDEAQADRRDRTQERASELRMELERYRQGRMDSRFQQGQAATESRFDRGQSAQRERFLSTLDQKERAIEQTNDLASLRLRRQVVEGLLQEGRLGGFLSDDGQANLALELRLIDQRLARDQGGARPAAQGATQAAPQARPAPQSRPAAPQAQAPPRPSPAPSPLAGGPVAVGSRREAEALPDGTLFSFNGRVFRKQGGALIAVQ